MSKRVCSTPGCPTLLDRSGKCPPCARAADRARGTFRERGYQAGHDAFRRAVLATDPVCRLCPEPATVADHWPKSRRELVAAGLDPDDPRHGRGLCAACHGRETAVLQPGGWNAP